MRSAVITHCWAESYSSALRLPIHLLINAITGLFVIGTQGLARRKRARGYRKENGQPLGNSATECRSKVWCLLACTYAYSPEFNDQSSTYRFYKADLIFILIYGCAKG